MNTNEKRRNLNTVDGWEAIVNENAKQRRYDRSIVIKWERERRMRKLWLSACGIAALGLTFVILGVTGAVSDWLATAICVASIATGSFVCGRYVEAKRG